MTKKPPHHGDAWIPKDDTKLREEVKHNTPTRVIGLHLGRTEDSIRGRAHELGVSLKPTNQSPYGTGGKGRK